MEFLELGASQKSHESRIVHSKTPLTFSCWVAFHSYYIAFDICVDNLCLIRCDPLSLVLISCYCSLPFFDLVWFVRIEKNTPIRTPTICLRGRWTELNLNTPNEKLTPRAIIWKCLDFLLSQVQAQDSVLLCTLPYWTSPSFDSLIFASLSIFYYPEAKNS